MTKRFDEGYWHHHGLQIGRELAAIDRTTGCRRVPAELPGVAGVPETFLAARALGYVESITGACSALEPLP